MQVRHPVLGLSRCVAALLILSAVPGCLVAADVTLAWDRNPESDIAGYRLYYGTVSRSYTQVVDVGNVVQRTLTGLAQGTYFFAVSAYNSSGLESGFSNEVAARLLDGGTGSRCDINADGAVNIFDITLLENVILGTRACPGLCDLNGDGMANIFDATILEAVILGTRSCP